MGMTEPSANVVTLLANAAARVPQRIALASRESVMTFAELWERVNATAAGLKRADVHSGDRVLCFVPMSVDLYVSLLALLTIGRRGGVCGPVDWYAPDGGAGSGSRTARVHRCDAQPLVAVMGAIPAHCARHGDYGKADRLVAGALDIVRIGSNRL